MAKWDLSLPSSESPMQCYHCGSKTLMRVITEKHFSWVLSFYDSEYGEVEDGTAWIEWKILKCPLCEKINVIESSADSNHTETIDFDEYGNEASEEIVFTNVLFPTTDLPPNPNVGKLIDIAEIPDDFYKNLIDEINSLYKYDFALSLSVLIRKLLENLLIDILRKKYGISGLSLYYDTAKRRFLDFSILLKNFESKQTDFQYITSNLDSKLIGEINSYRETGNSSAHSIDAKVKIEQFKDKQQDINYLIQFLFRLLKNTSS